MSVLLSSIPRFFSYFIFFSFTFICETTTLVHSTQVILSPTTSPPPTIPIPIPTPSIPTFNDLPTIEIPVLQKRVFTALDPLPITPKAEYRFSANVNVVGSVTFRRSTLPGDVDSICLVAYELGVYFCPEEHHHKITTVPTTIPFEITLAMGLGTYVLQVIVPIIPLNGHYVESRRLLIDIVPGKQHQVKKKHLLPFPYANQQLSSVARTPRISILIFDSTTIGGQEIMDLAKSRILSDVDTLDVHFLAEPLLSTTTTSLIRNNSNSNHKHKYKYNIKDDIADHGPLLKHYFAINDRIQVHLLVRLVGRQMASRFMSEQFKVLGRVETWEELNAPLKTALFPLYVLLHQMDLVSLPNSIQDPKLFNMLHMARLANVKSRVVELANIVNHEDMLESATMFVGPSSYACAHRLVTQLPIPCVVIHPVGINPSDLLKFSQYQRSPTQSPMVNRLRETVTFASVGRVYIQRSPGLFVRAAVSAAQTLHSEGGSISISILFVGKCNKAMCAALQSYLSGVPKQYRPIFRFVGEVEYGEVGQTLRDANVDVVVNPRLMETFGISIVEAMAMGIPTIACHGGGHDDIVQHKVDGLLVDCGNKNEGSAVLALATAILKMARNIELRQALGRQAPVSAMARFSDTIFRNKYAALYHSLSLSLRNHNQHL